MSVARQGARQYHKHVHQRQFNGTVLAYVTPW